MRIFTFLAVMLVMSACKPAEDAQAPAPSTGEPSRNYADEIAKLPRQARDAALFRAIRDAGLPCQKIIDSGPMPGAAAPAASWRAQCEDKAYHLIHIQPDGSAVVASRTTP
ncbi:hypothetical protein [Sphingobium sp. TKS]|uniref:hypothetical protein n=1 Tax=Sphingobium sp. TKS TaxID=1315974 RepID=UPI0007702399|nr:hypothetical protein [Sphingobium sp. TKS]AMK26277.1 hypothetical protein K426_26900 [Sphingobium sp. TKS]